MENKLQTKNVKWGVLLSFLALIISSLLLGVSYAWFSKQREMSTVTWIKTPIVLRIGAGNDHDIKSLDMGDIDVEGNAQGYKDYVVCVYGKPVDNYSLQLAYTTNIAFHYDVYRADKDEDGSISSLFDSEEERYSILDINNPVISGLSMDEVRKKGFSPLKFQSHKLSYGNDRDDNVVDREKVQGFNEPFYFLAEEDDTSVMRPLNIDENKESFLDYYIIRVSWDPQNVKNDKETDIVYISVSR